jgi:hypothetical protein
MNRKSRLAVLSGTAVAALAFAGNAFATQQLFVSQTSSTLTFKAQQAQGDQQPAKITINVPTGYQLATGQAVGTKIGTTTGDVFARDVGIPLPFTGDVFVDDPASQGPLAAACSAGPYVAVWRLHVVIGGAATVDLHFFVKQGGGPVAYTLNTCFGPSDTPPGSPNRSPSGAQLLDATLTMNGVFTTVANPAVWSSFWTPYAAGTGVPNAAGTVEARAFVGDGSVSLRAKVLSKKKKIVRLSGVVTQAGLGGVNAATVKLLINSKMSRFSKLSGATGAFTFNLQNTARGRTTTFFQAVATALARDVTSTGCANPTAPPIPCVSATANGITGRSAKIKVRI